jgi:alpha/beta superfamily hydrolase
MKKLVVLLTLIYSVAGVAQNKKELFVVTNHTQLGNTGETTGYFLSEVTHPLEVLTKELQKSPLRFDASKYTTQQVTQGDQTLTVRAYEGIVYVANPVEEQYQQFNLYIPEAYFNGGTINGFNAQTAPIFLPNGVGGYMPAKPLSLTGGKFKDTNNSLIMALSKGFVVASPGARGRTSATGRAPAVIVDLKAAVRYLKYNDK